MAVLSYGSACGGCGAWSAAVRRAVAVCVVMVVMAGLVGSVGVVRALAATGITVNVSRETATPDYTSEIQIGRVTIDPTGLGKDVTVSGAVVEFTVDTTWLRKFTVPAATGITDMVRSDNANGTATMRVGLRDFDATSAFSFPYSVKFKEGFTPEDYVFSPVVRLRGADGAVLAEGTGDAAMQVKYERPFLTKFVNNNKLDDFSYDNVAVYAGTVQGNRVVDPEDIRFQFSLADYARLYPSTYNARYRAADRIVLTDILPTYRNGAGAMVRATFDPAKNPGWKDNGDGSVSYAVDNPGGAPENFDSLVGDTTLILQFPDASLADRHTNTVKATLTPVAQGPKEGLITAEDSLRFQLSSDPLPQGSVFRKTSANGNVLSMDLAANYDSLDEYTLSVRNGTAFPMKNIVLRDDTFDDRMYIRGVTLQSSIRKNVTIYGLTFDGQRIPLENKGYDGNSALSAFDRQAYESIMSQVDRVKAGMLAEADTVKANQRFKGVELEFDPNYVMQPGESFNARIILALNDPYHTKPLDDPERNTYRNTADLSFTSMSTPAGQTVTVSDTAESKARAKAEQISFSKDIIGNRMGRVGEQVLFDIGLGVGELSQGRRVRNPVIVDVLPKGLEYKGFVDSLNSDWLKSSEVIDDYHGSGRQALVLHLKDINRDESAPVRYLYRVTGVITESMVPLGLEDDVTNNDNHAYFTADGWDPLPEGVGVQGNKSGLVSDVFDVDGDGSTTDLILHDSVNVKAALPMEVRSEKSISLDGTHYGPGPIDVPYAAPFHYRLQSFNYSPTALQDFEIYDALPSFSDGAGPVHLTGPASASQEYEVMYRTAAAPSGTSDEVAATVADDKWMTADQVDDWSAVTAVKARLKDGAEFARTSELNVDLPVVAPAYKDATQAGARSSNRFWRSLDKGATFGQTNAVDAYLMQRVPVEKRWVGPALDQIKVVVKEASAPDADVDTATLSAANQWRHVFELPAFTDDDHTVRADYTVQERLGDEWKNAYTAMVSGDMAKGFVITNTSVPVVPPELPHAGGWGSDWFVLSGVALLLVAGVAGVLAAAGRWPFGGRVPVAC